MLAVVSVQGKTDKLYATFGSPTGNASYSAPTFSWTGTSNNLMTMFTLTAGDLSKYKTLNLTVTNFTANFRIVYSTGSTTKQHTFYSGGTKVINLSEEASSLGFDLDAITLIRVAGNQSTTGSIDILASEVYLETAEYEYMGIKTPISGFTWYTYNSDPVAEYTGSVGNGLNNSRGQNAVIYGFNNATSAYIDVTGYDNAQFTLSTAGTQGIRLMYNDATITINTNSTDAVYTQSLSTMPKIATIKTKNAGGQSAITVSDIDFIKEFNASSTTAFSIAASTSSTVEYDRAFTAGQKSTVCLPFAVAANEVNGEFWEFTGVTGTTLNFTKVTTTTEAYTPYVYVAGSTAKPFASLSARAITATPETAAGYACTPDGSDYTFQGTLARISDVAEANSSKVCYGYNADRKSVV